MPPVAVGVDEGWCDAVVVVAERGEMERVRMNACLDDDGDEMRPLDDSKGDRRREILRHVGALPLQTLKIKSNILS